MVAVVLVMLVVIIMVTKILGGKGTILSGGIISGHAAIAFVLAGRLIRPGWVHVPDCEMFCCLPLSGGPRAA